MPIAQAGERANGNQAASIKAILHQAQGLSPTRRVNARDNAVRDHRQSSALRHGGCGPRLRPCRTDEARRDYRRLALRCHDHHWGSRLPTANELEGARYQGRKIAETANKLHGYCLPPTPFGTMWMANRCGCFAMRRGLGLPHAGRSHRGHGDPVAAKLLQEAAAVSQQVLLGPVFRFPAQG
jgi:hypothetical protein